MALAATGLLVALPTIGGAAERSPAEIVEAVCSKCHGPGGHGQSSLFPRLAGQQASYLERQLLAFRGRDRGDAHGRSYMWGIAGPLSDRQIHDLAQYLSAQPMAEHTASSAPDLVAKGKEIFEHGIASRAVPACAECHGHEGMGIEEIPSLAGQYRDYLYRQIQDFRGLLRRNEIMHDTTRNVTDEEALALAEYLSSR